MTDRTQQVPDCGDRLLRRYIEGWILLRNAKGLLSGMRIGTVLHPAVLVAFSDYYGFRSTEMGPPAQRPDCGRSRRAFSRPSAPQITSRDLLTMARITVALARAGNPARNRRWARPYRWGKVGG
jgi:hypothetical protein